MPATSRRSAASRSIAPEATMRYVRPFRLHQDLIGMRRRQPWLHHARTRVVDLANTHFVYQAFHGEHRLLVALNLTDAPVTRQVPYLGDIVAGNAACHHTGASQMQMTVPPHG